MDITQTIDNDRIMKIDIEEEMKSAYIDYSMSVIVARALPDVRDGFKPVHRRILFGMNELGNTSDKPYKKSARIVGEVLGKYHPHGDSSVYFAMVRMAQKWAMRYCLVDGQGNFGSVDGDSPAAMRYTEARLSKLAEEMLRDIDKETVDFQLNFDDTLKEPTVLPTRIPNLLVNGASGIAVGMATNMPTHNLSEVLDGCVAYIDTKGDIDVAGLMQFIKAPDFPTGATILGTRGIEEAYRTGRGKIRVRAVTNIETLPNGKSRIVVTELPYLVNKARLIEKIAELVRDKKIDGITDLNDHSSREGMRICIDLRKDANANVILNLLYKHTQLQDTFGVIMLSLVPNHGSMEPKVLNLKEMLEYYLEHQENVVRRRTQYDLNKAQERAHILEGLLKALDNIDEVIRIIRGSRNVQIAKQELIERFELTDVQAQAIVDMRLRALTGLEREKLEAEYAELMEKIRKFQAILADRKLLLRVIREEILAIAEKYGDDRKTSIGYDVYDISTEDLIPRENTVIAMTKLGYIKRMTVDNFRSQNRGGRGIKGMQTIEDDYIEELLMTTTHHYLMFFTNTGRVYRLKAYEIPEAGRTARGTAIINLLQLAPGEKITAVIPLRKYEEGHYLMMATKKGLVKKTPIRDYENVRKTGLTAIVLRDDDELIEVKATDNNKDIILVTRDGQCIRFKETDVRSTGRASMGVRGMNLTDGDEVVAMQLNTQGDYLLVVSENGMGKRTAMSEFVVQNRGGKGVKCYKITEKTGNVVGAKAVNEENEIMMITTEGIIIRLQCADISVLGRITSGVKMINLTEGVTVASIAKVRDKDPEADTTTEKADGETGDNEEDSAEEAVTGSEEE